MTWSIKFITHIHTHFIEGFFFNNRLKFLIYFRSSRFTNFFFFAGTVRRLLRSLLLHLLLFIFLNCWRILFLFYVLFLLIFLFIVVNCKHVIVFDTIFKEFNCDLCFILFLKVVELLSLKVANVIGETIA